MEDCYSWAMQYRIMIVASCMGLDALMLSLGSEIEVAQRHDSEGGSHMWWALAGWLAYMLVRWTVWSSQYMATTSRLSHCALRVGLRVILEKDFSLPFGSRRRWPDLEENLKYVGCLHQVVLHLSRETGIDVDKVRTKYRWLITMPFLPSVLGARAIASNRTPIESTYKFERVPRLGFEIRRHHVSYINFGHSCFALQSLH